jgi:hypothetical protein
MRILACYANMDPRTKLALAAYAPDADIVNVGGDDTAYAREIGLRWDGADDLAVIEQDIEITAAVIPAFGACSEPWCSFWYRGPSFDMGAGDLSRLNRSLGCTKFSAALQRAVPWSAITTRPLAWDVVDVHIATALLDEDYYPHDHGEVRTFHSYTIYWLDPDRNGGRRWTWRHTDDRDCPTGQPGRTPTVIPPGCDREIHDASGLFGEPVTQQ